MSNILLFGLSADPLHKGHEAYIDLLKSSFPNHSLVLMPCCQNPIQKYDQAGLPYHQTDAELRWQMLRAHFAHDNRVEVSRYEIDANCSYTFDTVMHYKQQGHEVTLVLGADNLLQLPRWHRYEDIVSQTAMILVLTRAGYAKGFDKISEPVLLEGVSLGKIKQLEGPSYAMSSTQIRAMFAANMPKNQLLSFVSEDIFEFIIQHKQQMSKAYHTLP